MKGNRTGRRLGAVAVCLILALCLLTGCAPRQQQYSVTYLDLFDTVTTIVARAGSQAEFDALAAQAHDSLLEYHRLFDIYNDYSGITNLKAVNDRAGQGPVEVDPAIIALLEDCKDYYDLTGGRVDVTMGAVLKLWHDARNAGIEDPENASLPDGKALEAAAAYRGWAYILIDREASTVTITDPHVRLDVGAIAKGWAVQQVAESLPSGVLLNVGGNVVATGPKDADNTPWSVGIQDPDNGDSFLHIVALTQGSAVTSGDYQRTYQVAGQSYHHIIDPDTLYPSTCWRSVTILCDDSGLADALSTALFLLPLEEGQALLDQTGAFAVWVDRNGEIFYSPGFEDHIRT